MIRLIACVAVSLVVGVSVPTAQVPQQRRGSHSAGGTLPASAVAAVTWVTYSTDRGDDPGLLVIWRGAPGWYMKSPSGGSGGGSRDAYNHTDRFGDTHVSLVLTASPRTLTVQDTIKVDIGTHTVVLVDEVDGANGGKVVKTLDVDLTGLGSSMGLAELGQILRRSPEAFDFLRCDITPEPGTRAMTTAVCREEG